MAHPARRAASPFSPASSAAAPGSTAPALLLDGGRSGPPPPPPALAAADHETHEGDAGTVMDGVASAEAPIEDSRKRRAESEDNDGEHCIICLQEVRDRTVIVTCGHDHFCFHCINVWADQSRKCPLCSRPMGDYLLHDLQTPPPFVKFFLPPFAKPSTVHPQHPILPPARRRQYQQQARRRMERAPSEEGDFERRLERRREIYRYGLYAKHIASNPTTRYKPAPTPAQFAANPDLVARAQVFLRREFLVWTGVDTEFMVTYVVGLMQSIDIRSDAAVRLLRDFLDVGSEQEDAEGGGRAEHFAHEVYSFLRSPFRDLKLYDAAVQYDDVPQSSLPSRRSSPPASARASRSAPSRPPPRDDKPHDRPMSAFETLVDDGEGGGMGEALGGTSGRVVRGDDDADDMSSDSESSSRGRSRSRDRRGSISRSRTYDSRSSYGSRSRSRDGRSVDRRSYSRDRYSPSRSRSPGPSRRGGRYRSRSFSPRGRHPGPPLSPRRWNQYDSWVSPEERDRLGRVRGPRERGGPLRRDDYRRDEFRRDGFPRSPDERVPRSGREALPDQGALFGQRGARRPGAGSLGMRRDGPPAQQQRPPPTTVDLMEVDPLGEGMRAWSSGDSAPVTSIDPAASTPQEADARAAAGPGLLGRIAGLDPKLGLRISGRAANGKAPPTGPRATRSEAATSLGIRGAARQESAAAGLALVDAPPPANGKDEPAPVKAKGPPKNVLLQRLAEAKADALRVSALKAARAADASASPASTSRSSPPAGDAETPTSIGVPPLKPAPASSAIRRKPDVSALKSRILERLQAEKLKADVAESGPASPATAKVAAVGGAAVDGPVTEGGLGAQSEEQALRRQLLDRRKA